MMTLSGLNQHYGESQTLWDFNLEVEQGSCTCIMGRNGVGKTTLLKCVMGLESLTSGEVLYNGEDLSRRPAADRARKRIGYVPQGREIFSQLTIEENLRIGLYSRQDKLREIPPLIFELFPVLKDMLGRRGGDLSGGQQQQLAIGRALALNPQLLILDETTEGIQPNIVQEIGAIIRRLNKELGLTVLLVEQKLPFARLVADKFCLMERGRAVANGEMGELTDDLVQRYLTV